MDANELLKRRDYDGDLKHMDIEGSRRATSRHHEDTRQWAAQCRVNRSFGALLAAPQRRGWGHSAGGAWKAAVV